jgi:RHS repeat-associated protein
VTSTGFRSTARLLILALALSLLPTQVTVAAAAPAEPSGAAPQGQAKGRLEQLGLRSPFAKHFKTDDGRTTVEIYATPIHYQDAQGNWVEIDNRLVDSKRSDFKWTNKANSFAARFAGRAQDGLARIEVGDHWVAWTVKGARPADGQVVGNLITYPQVYDGVDLRYQTLPKGVKEEFVLSGPKVPLSYSFALQTDLSVSPAGGGLQLTDAAGGAILTMPAPFAVDAAGATEPLALSESGGGGYELSVAEAWLRDPARSFPIVLDPSFVLTPDAISGMDTWIDGKAPAMNYGGDGVLRVGNDTDSLYRSLLKFNLTAIPQGARVTDATLELHRVNGYGGTAAVPYALHELNRRPWLEDEATWTKATESVNWTSTGGDFNTETVLDGEKNLVPAPGSANNVAVTWNVTSPIARMATTRENYGFLLKSSSEDPALRRLIEFASSDAADLTLVPKLTVTYQEDLLPPSVTITPATVLSGQATISAQVTDTDSGVDRVEFLVDGGVVETVFGPTFSMTLNTTNYANGDHVIDVRAYDRAGNVGTAQQTVLLADEFNDETAIATKTGGATVSNGLVSLGASTVVPITGTPVVSAVKAAESHGAALLKDGNTDTYWKSPGRTGAGSTESVVLDLGSSKYIYQIAVVPRLQADALEARAELLDASGNPLNRTYSDWVVLNAGGTSARYFDLSFARGTAPKIRVTFTNLTADPLTGLSHANVAEIRVRTEYSDDVQDMRDIYSATGKSETNPFCDMPISTGNSCLATWRYAVPSFGTPVYSGQVRCPSLPCTFNPPEVQPGYDASYNFTMSDPHTQYTDGNGITRWSWTKHAEQTFTRWTQQAGYSTHYSHPTLPYTPNGDAYNESNVAANIADGRAETQWVGTAVPSTNSRTDTAWVELPFVAGSTVNTVYINPLFEGMSARLILTNNGQPATIVDIANLKQGNYAFTAVTANKLRIEMSNLQGAAAPYYAGLSEVQVLNRTSTTTGDILSAPRTIPIGATSLVLNLQEQKPTGTQITYNLRFDGGAPVTATPGVAVTVPSGAKSVQAGATLSGTSAATPNLAKWTLTTAGSGLVASFQNGATVAPPVENATVTIASPAMLAVVTGTVPVQVTSTATDTNKVEFYVDGVKQATLTAKPWNWTWTNAPSAPSGTHIIQAVAYNAAGKLGGSTVAVRLPTGSPTNLNVVPESTTQNMRLSWQGVPGAASYTIARSTDNFATVQKSWSVPGLTTTDPDAKVAGTTYYYRVTAAGGSRPSLTRAAVVQAPLVGLNRFGLERFYPYAGVDLFGADSYLNLTNGNLVVADTDLTVPGPGLVMTVRRTFNSLPDSQGGLKPRWRWNHEITAQTDPTSQSVTITNADGAMYLFPFANGAYQRPAGVYIQVSRTNGVLTATHKNGIIWTFDTTGRLSNVVDRNSNRISYIYDPQGRMVQAVHSAGITIDYTYDAAGYLIKVAAGPADDRREVSYVYETNTGALSQVTDLAGNVWNYLYDGDQRLLGLLTPSGALWSLTYAAKGQVGSVVSPLTDTMAYAYSAGSTVVTDPRTYQTTFAFNTTGQLTQRTQKATPYDIATPETITVAYQYDEDFNLTRLTDPLGHASTATYDGRGNTLTMTQPAADTNSAPVTTTYSYVDGLNPDLPTQVVSALNTVESSGYDASGNLTSWSKGTLGQTPSAQKSFSYFDNGARAAERDEWGGVTHYEYDSFGHLQRLVDPVGYPTTYGYDWFGNKTRETDQEGNITQVSYDRAGRLLQVTGPDGGITRTALNPDGLVIKTVDPNGSAISYGYDRAGRLTSKTDLSGVTRIQYDGVGNQVALTNPNGWTTRMAFDEINRLKSTQVSVTTPAAATYTTYQKYDLGGNVIRVKNANAHEMAVAYDNLGRQVSQTIDPGTTGIQAISTTQYDGLGRLIATVDPVWHKLSYGYDDLGRQTEVRENLLSGNQFAVETTTTSEFTANGATLALDTANHLNGAKSLKVTAPGTVTGEGVRVKVPVRISKGQLLTGTVNAIGSGSVTLRLWDRKNGASISSTPVTLTSTGWTPIPPITMTMSTVDSDDFVLEVATSAKQAATFYLDGLEVNQVIRTTYSPAPTGMVAASGMHTTSMTNALGQTRVTTYDLLGRVVSEADPQGNAQTYTYRTNQHSMDRVDAEGRVTTYTYDTRGRVSTVQYPDGTSVAYTYDGNGNRLTMRDALGVTSATYDALNRPTRVVDPYGREVSYQYTGAVLSRVQSLAGAVNYTYNEAGMPISVALVDPQNLTQTATLKYDGLGQLTQQDVGTQRINWTYNTAEQLNQVRGTKSGSQLYQQDYTYDKAGNRATYTSDSTGAHNYTYDPLQRLVKATDSGAYRTYEYDGVGNRLRRSEYTGSTLTTDEIYTYNQASRLTRMDKTKSGTTETTTFGYDRIGNQVLVTDSKGSTTFQYDAENRLVQQQFADGSVVTNRYNGDGQRLYTRDKVRETYSLYDRGAVLASLDGAGAMIASYLQDAGGRPMLTQQQTGTYLFQVDGLNSVIGLTKQDGTWDTRYVYDEFGILSATKGTAWNDRTYTGASYGESSGLYHMGARYYNPQVGRFLTQDTWKGSPWQPWTQHLYSYVGNSPVNYVDPTGHMPHLLKNLAAQVYSHAPISSGVMSAAVFATNFATGGIWELFNSFHDIAQINIVKALGGQALLEVPLIGTRADVVGLGAQVWEVKPLLGASAQRQLLAAAANGLVPGTTLLGQVLEGITIAPNLYMRINFPAPGEARYSFYRYNDEGQEVSINTMGAVRIVSGWIALGGIAAVALVGAIVAAPEITLPSLAWLLA